MVDERKRAKIVAEGKADQKKVVSLLRITPDASDSDPEEPAEKREKTLKSNVAVQYDVFGEATTFLECKFCQEQMRQFSHLVDHYRQMHSYCIDCDNQFNLHCILNWICIGKLRRINFKNKLRKEYN